MRVGLSTVGKDLDERGWIKRWEIDHSRKANPCSSIYIISIHEPPPLHALQRTLSVIFFSLSLIESMLCCGALFLVCFMWLFMYVLFACVCLVVCLCCLYVFVCAVVKWWFWERQPQPISLWTSKIRAMMVDADVIMISKHPPQQWSGEYLFQSNWISIWFVFSLASYCYILLW